VKGRAEECADLILGEVTEINARQRQREAAQDSRIRISDRAVEIEQDYVGARGQGHLLILAGTT
jgi:hypothetical protein